MVITGPISSTFYPTVPTSRIPLSDVAQANIQETTRSWIQEKGRNPVEALRWLMQKNQVVLVGEQHDANPHRLAGAEYIRALAAGGATHLAVEADPHDQAGIDHYMLTGDPSMLATWMRVADYMPILAAAREAGLKVVAIDNKKAEVRNKVMAQGVEQIVRSDPDAKVVVWLGSKHVGDHYYADGKLHPYSSVTTHLKNSETIRGGVVSVGGVFGDFHSLHRIAPVNTPTLIPTKGSPLEKVVDGRPDVVNFEGGSFDYIILYPTEVRHLAPLFDRF